MQWLLEFMGVNEFMPTSPLMELLGATVCRANNPIKGICSNILFLIAGYNVDQLNTTAVPIILGKVLHHIFLILIYRETFL